MHDPESHEHASQYGGGVIIDAESIAALRELGGEEDPGLVIELIELFLDDATERMHNLESAWNTGDLDTVARCAHALKSASANMGALSFSGVCKSVEQTADAGDRAQVADPVERCLGMYSEVQAALQAMRAAG